jgi:hypothetical protein
MTRQRGKRRSPEQIERKLRDADSLPYLTGGSYSSQQAMNPVTANPEPADCYCAAHSRPRA